MQLSLKKIVLYYFLFLSSFLMIFSAGVIDSQDGFQYLAVARNIYYKGEPTAPPYEYDQRQNIHMSVVTGKDGKAYSLTGLGYSIAYLPAVALTDFFYKFYGASPSEHFPLENDWLIFLIAGFTNAFFGAFLGVILYLYLIELGLSSRQALFISFTGIVCTNLFVYTKHSFAHMMFISFLLACFYFIKKNSKTKMKIYLFGSGIAFGVHALSYNMTYILSVIPVGVYFILLDQRKKLNLRYLKLIATDSIFFLVGFIPFFLVYHWFENTRASVNLNLGSLAVAPIVAKSIFNIPIGVFYEGVFGQLFSSGRSIFLYSPILLVILIFWAKIKKVIKPELVVFILMCLIYVLFFSTLYTIGVPGGGQEESVAANWHGEASWGPRYLTPLVAYGMLIIGYIFTRLSRFQKAFIFFPLLVLGFIVQMLGIILPYQIKFHDLQPKFFVNSTEYTNFAYSNLLPRYSPVILMAKNLVKLSKNFPETFNHGQYNVKFYDGIDFPFPVGGERWRVIDKKGYLRFDDSSSSPVKKITLGLINHPIEDASYSATIQASVNEHRLFEKEQLLMPAERKLIDLEIPHKYLQPKDNQLMLEVNFKPLKEEVGEGSLGIYRDSPADYSNKNVQPKKYVSQILGLIAMSINDEEVNKESLDFPYISSLGPPLTGKKYQNYGGVETDPWKSWDIHTQMYERLPDFWWIRNLYYWDIPKVFILLPFAGIILMCIFTGYKIYKYTLE